MGPVHDKARLKLDKKEKPAKLTNSPMFLKPIDFKLRKTIRYQLKFFKCLL